MPGLYPNTKPIYNVVLRDSDSNIIGYYQVHPPKANGEPNRVIFGPVRNNIATVIGIIRDCQAFAASNLTDYVGEISLKTGEIRRPNVGRDGWVQLNGPRVINVYKRPLGELYPQNFVPPYEVLRAGLALWAIINKQL